VLKLRGLWMALACLGATLSAQATFHPAQYIAGPLPPVPVRALGGGEVLLELAVSDAGTVADVKTLRTTPPFTAQFVAAVRAWRFRPAERLTPSADRARPATWRPFEATVLVAGVIRPPTMNTPTAGELPRDVGSEADDTPFPLSVIAPPFPPRARDDGSVLVQVTIDAGGRVSDAKVLQSSPGFDEAALTTARTWVFRPARVRGESVATYAYLVFVFRQPVTTPAAP
jgi:TonB family protein